MRNMRETFQVERRLPLVCHVHRQLWGQLERGDKYIVISLFRGSPQASRVADVKAIAYFMLRGVDVKHGRDRLKIIDSASVAASAA